MRYVGRILPGQRMPEQIFPGQLSPANDIKETYHRILSKTDKQQLR